MLHYLYSNNNVKCTRLKGVVMQHLAIPGKLKSDMVARIVKEHHMSEADAAAVIEEALVFMHISANNPDSGLGPSPLVDIGWHTFILYTREYTDYCNAAFGEYLHHCPHNAVEQATIARPVSDTVQFMAAHGIVYDAELWGLGDKQLVMANCTVDCDGGGNGGGSACKGQCS